MSPQQVPDVLDELKREAVARAEHLGHRLQVFRASKHDPSCSVSFCADCRQMVIVALEKNGEPRGSLFGYALEARCQGEHAAAPARPLAAVETR